ncbi:DNA double-strand break repair ATPase Rad50 [Palaeococcus ferrophilus]|uniref:DNA double-strand break repair ATPase Rad50 n=1 Tax=Palaeococcus ferrophilus TaxID=83868 RepID=UPI00064FD01D|nr:DNA double-strand break repair ATPase Rad50 [Palaeococcus ferrophilus]
MRIKALRVADFRSHELTELEFGEGITLLIGENGAGKSSILEAMMVALYWDKPSRTAKLKKEWIGRIEGENRLTPKIRLDFWIDGDEYVAYRELPMNKPGEARLFRRVDGELETVESGHSNVTSHIERFLPFDVFMNAVYIRQGEIDAILESDEKRERVIRDVLGLERFDRAYDNAKRLIDRLKNEKKVAEEIVRAFGEAPKRRAEREEELSKALEKKKGIEADLRTKRAELEGWEKKLAKLEEKERKLRDLEKDRADLEKRKASLEAKREALERSIADLKREIAELEEKKSQWEALKPKAELYTGLLEFKSSYESRERKLLLERKGLEAELRNTEKGLAELEAKEKRFEELSAKRDVLLKEKEGLEPYREKHERLTSLRKEIERLQKKTGNAEKLKAELENAKRELEEIRKRLEEVKSDIRLVEAEIERREEFIEEIESAEGSCPLCRQPLDGKHKEELLGKFRLEKDELEKRYRSLWKEKKELGEREKVLKKVLENEDRINALYSEFLRLRELMGELEKLPAEDIEKNFERLREVEKELYGIEGELKTLEKDVKKRDEYRKRLEELKESLERNGREMKALQEELWERGFESMEELEKKLEELKADYERFKTLEGSLKTLEGKKRALAEKEEALKKTVTLIGELSKRLGEIEKEVEALNFSEEELRKAREAKESVGKLVVGLTERLSALEKEIKNLEREIEELREQERKAKESGEKLKILEVRIPELERFRKKIREYKNRYKLSALSEISRDASEIFAEMTEEKYSAVVAIPRENKVELKVLYGNEERDLSFLSGGERISLALAFRLALSRYLAAKVSKSGITLLILDEPTPYLDEERRKRLVEIMQSYLRRIPQVIVVSHDEELKDAADRVIKVALVDGVSRVSEEKVEGW